MTYKTINISYIYIYRERDIYKHIFVDIIYKWYVYISIYICNDIIIYIYICMYVIYIYIYMWYVDVQMYTYLFWLIICVYIYIYIHKYMSKIKQTYVWVHVINCCDALSAFLNLGRDSGHNDSIKSKHMLFPKKTRDVSNIISKDAPWNSD